MMIQMENLQFSTGFVQNSMHGHRNPKIKNSCGFKGVEDWSKSTNMSYLDQVGLVVLGVQTCKGKVSGFPACVTPQPI